jgi:hypothetical protein
MFLSAGAGAFAQAQAGVSATIDTGSGYNTAGVAFTGEFVAQAPQGGTSKRPTNGSWKLKESAKLPRSSSALAKAAIFSQLLTRAGGPRVVFELAAPTGEGAVTILESTGGVLKFTQHGRDGSFKLTLQTQSYPSSSADGTAFASGNWSCF